MKKYTFTIQGKTYEVTINNAHNGTIDMDVNGKNFVVGIEQKQIKVTPPTPVQQPQIIEPKTANKPVVSTENQPHTIMKIFAETGQEIKKGDTLFVMESNGHECTVTADKDGIVGNINVRVGKYVSSEGATIELNDCKQKTTNQSVTLENAILAPLPGTIVQILKPEGCKVNQGDIVLTMDSMKMVNNVLADKSGTITHIVVTERQAVLEGDPLFTIES